MSLPSESQQHKNHRSEDLHVEDLPEEDLALAISHANGNPSESDKLFQILWSRVEKTVAQNVRSMLCNYPDAISELTTEVQHRVREKIHQYHKKPGASFRSWLYRLTTNTVFNWIRKEKRKILMSQMDEWTIDLIFGTVPSTQEDYINNETRTIIRGAVEKLPSNEQQVVILMDYEGMSVKEVACKLSISESLVKTRHYRAKRRLEHILKSQNFLESLRS